MLLISTEKQRKKEREKRESKIKLQHVIGKVNRSHHEVHVQTVIAGGARDDVTLVGGRKDGDVGGGVVGQEIRG